MPSADEESDMSSSGTAPAAAPAAPASPSQSPSEGAVSVLWSFGKCLAALLPVYLAGYYGFSISLVLLGLVVYTGYKHGRLEKEMRLKASMYLLDNEMEFNSQKLFRARRDLPPWVRGSFSAACTPSLILRMGG